MLTVLRSMLGYMRPYKGLAALFFLTLGLDLAFVSIAPLSFQVIIDKAVEPKDMAFFLKIMLVLGITGVICLGAGVLSDYTLAKLNTRVQDDLRKQLFAHLQRLPLGFYQKSRSGDLVAYFSVDLPAIEGAMAVILTTGIKSLTVVVISAILLFYLQWSMALLILLGALVIFIGPYLLSRRAQVINTAYRDELAAMTSELHENMKAQKVIKGFNLRDAMMAKFTRRLQSLFISSYKKNILGAQLERIPMVSLLLINFTIIGFGSYLALTGRITVGALVAFFTMYTSMGNAMFGLTFILPVFAEAQVSMDRIGQLLDEPPEAYSRPNSIVLQETRSLDVTVKEVTFGYSESRAVLENISLKIPAGTTAAFVGSSGSGKSTLLQLLLGFYEPAAGQIEINGIDMRSLNRDSYRDQIGVVFQDNFLFHGTLLENIRLGKPHAAREEVVTAARQAEIHDFIMSLPDGYDTMVQDEGNNFSGGQRQRLAIARAILRNPTLLLLDEATSALDPISEAAINRTFAELSRDRTVITVTHRLSAVAAMDQIYVFDRGKLVDSGRHEQMLERGGYYKMLWDKQSGLSLSNSGKDAAIDPQRLALLPFFRGIDTEVLQEITHLFNTETFEAGQAVIHEGEPGEKFYLIARGRVEVTKASPDAEAGHIRLAVLEDGDHFGEIALLENVPRTATVTALTPCVCLTLQRKVLVYLLSKHPEIDAYVRDTLKERRS
ncbi:ATP-binding cassette domain-containing protein [Brevibacillus migulae]|uniref:ATP-binding cassette domain-containing protein n=1 Tax=Brevibacillus migulae TaxID=1644114 RepID=UPI00106E56A3|nr:ATP-binding cassette domain-containing protein [Brevibacillus migulae]